MKLTIKSDGNIINYIDKGSSFIFVSLNCYKHKKDRISIEAAPNSLIIVNDGHGDHDNKFNLVLSNDEDDKILFEDYSSTFDSMGGIITIPYRQ